MGGDIEIQKLVIHANKEVNMLAEKVLKVMEDEEGRYEHDEEQMAFCE